MSQSFYSNGKLLISGEYLVLDGAKALALPTQFGQSMEVEHCDEAIVSWTAYDADGSIWMNESISIDTIISEQLIEGSNYLQTLVNVLRAAHRQNATVLQCGTGYRVVSKLSFPRQWGLGTSSTWINNVAQWFGINAFQLLANSFGGSGYDIACAQHKTALYYTRVEVNYPQVDTFDFNPSFRNNLYFVYLNQKRSSKEAIASYKQKRSMLQSEIDTISGISEALVGCVSLEEFQHYIVKHEAIISSIIEQVPVKASLFSDFDGEVKSLGAWGGDFVLVASQADPTLYFNAKGYHVVVKYNNMILE